MALWTWESVWQVMEARFGTALTVASVRRTLPDLGLSAQRPLSRAAQADPVAVARWKEIEYPKIAVGAKAAGGVVFVVDEAGVRLEDHAGTPWAPVGATPPGRTTSTRCDLSMISVISAKGTLRFSVLVGTLAAAGFIAFQRLLHATAQRSSGPVFGVVDNHPAHRAKAVDRVVDSPQAALRLSGRPAHAAQLNPDEWGWTNVTHDSVAPAAPNAPKQVKTVITTRLPRLQRLPHLVRSFFGDPELAYITTVT